MNMASMLCLVVLFLGMPVLMAEELPAKNPDNTVRNVRERNEAEKDPVDQNENKADLEISRNIRKSIVDDKSLSTYAHNIKIITQNGVVNLKGPVRSVTEKSAVERIAIAVAGANNVKSQIDISPVKTDRAIETSVEEKAPVKEPIKADNTDRNKRERNDLEKTPIDQNENKADLEITRRIRRAIVDDKNLSMYAHNIKIMTQEGAVTLKGPVRSVVEKTQVEQKALAVAGEGKVESQLEVAPKDSK